MKLAFKNFLKANNEIESPKLLAHFERLLSPKFGLINSFSKINNYNDEPQIFQYSAAADTTLGNIKIKIGGIGTSFSEDKAKVKTLGEALERLSLVQKPDLKLSVKKTKDKKLDIKNLPEFYKKPVKENNKKNLPLIKGYYLNSFSVESAEIPAQLVFVPYKFSKSEFFLRPPISTGAATGLGYADAILRGLLEVIEKDAFVITYFQKEINNKVEIEKDRQLNLIKKELNRCKLNLSVYDISAETGPYVFLAITLDRTGYGPPISSGLKAGYNPKDVALGAIEESLHSRTWIRDSFHANFKSKNVAKIKTIEDRLIYWLNPNLLKTMGFYKKTKRSISIKKYKNKEIKPVERQLQNQLKLLSKLKMSVYFHDLTPPKVKKIEFRVVKVIVPELQPLYLDESYNYPQGPRLKKIINKVPHFFL